MSAGGVEQPGNQHAFGQHVEIVTASRVPATCTVTRAVLRSRGWPGQLQPPGHAPGQHHGGRAMAQNLLGACGLDTRPVTGAWYLPSPGSPVARVELEVLPRAAGPRP